METFSCETCAQTLQSKQAYETHLVTDRHKWRSQIRNGEITSSTSHTCKNCNKIFAFHSGFYRHRRICSVVPSTPSHTETLDVLEQIKKMLLQQQTPKEDRTKVKSESPEYIYLLREREFVQNGQPIYKLGKTKQPNQNRFAQYPKESVLLYHRICHSCHNIEKQLIQRFKEVFTQRTDIGSEYFEGDSFTMMEHMDSAVYQDHSSWKTRK